MKAYDVTGTPPGGNRVPICELVPMNTPLLVHIFPIYACNFRCKYCMLSLPKSDRCFVSDIVTMKLDLFKKCVDDLGRFPGKVKVIRFVGIGEPLLHKQLSEMIKYAADSKLFERIEVLTNGSLLTHELTHRLVSAGLTKLLISIQGTSSSKYKAIADVTINLAQYIDNIRYFYEHRGNTLLHIKIIDCALENDDDKTKFYTLFGDICDTIGIEFVGPIHPGVDYDSILTEFTTLNQYGVTTANMNICTQPFFNMQINPDGNIVPCYSAMYPSIMGNCNIESLYDIWNGPKYNQFRYDMLSGTQHTNAVCQNCNMFRHRAYPDERLEPIAEQLKEFYRAK